jgi:gluconate 2-dehydrogenase gamma chain
VDQEVQELRPGSQRRLSRRSVLGRAVGLGAALSASSGVAARAAGAAMPMPKKKKKAKAPPKGALDATQLRTLEAMVARIVPSDASGPGALEAGAANFINLQLAGWPSERNSLAATIDGTSVSSSVSAYTVGLAAVDAYALARRSVAFASLTAAEQDGLLTEMQNGTATGSFSTNLQVFFNLVRTHTLQGMLSDPYYGGNKNFLGWTWVGYPGIRMPVKAEHQKLGSRLPLRRMSAYEMGSFKGDPPTKKG